MAAKKKFLTSPSKNELRELKNMVSERIEELTPVKLEQLVLYFIKRNNVAGRSKQQAKAHFKTIISDMESQFNENWLSVSKESRTKLAKSLNRLVKRGIIDILFEVSEPHFPGLEWDVYEVACVLQVNKH